MQKSSHASRSRHAEIIYAQSLGVTLTYGIFLFASCSSLVLLYRYARDYAGRRPVAIYTTCMSVITTVWSIAIVLENGAVLLDESLLAERCHRTFLLGKITAALQLLGGDALLLYKMYIVWNGDLRVIVPFSLIYLTSVGAMIVRDVFFCVHPGSMSTATIAKLVMNYSFLAFNITALLLIALKLWRAKKALPRDSLAIKKQIFNTFAMVCKLAAFYMIVAAVDLPAFFSKSKTLFQIADSVLQDIIVLVPAFLILDVAMRQYRRSIAAQALAGSLLKVLDDA